MFANPVTVTYGYNQNDLPTTRVLSGTLQAGWGYDANSRLITATALGPQGASAPISQTYQYGSLPIGWTSGVTASGTLTSGVTTYSHDALGRLIGAQGVGGTGSWSYDGDGNLTQAVQSGITTTYGYAPTATYSPTTWLPGELIVLTTTNQPTGYLGYDSSGHTTLYTNTAGITQTVSYDTQGRFTGTSVVSSTYLLTTSCRIQRPSTRS